MARKGAATPSGLVLFDKPAGPSSFAIVRDLRERTGARAGHAGTLDPFATGLLLVLLGSFTKQAQRFVGLPKRYETVVDLSRVTSTGDPEGEMVEEHEPPPEAELRERLEALRGEVDLKIPAASAVKIGGERAYRLHRRGVAVEMPVRSSTIHALRIVRYAPPLLELDLHVSSGTYVRAIADALGGHCRWLRRTAVGPFRIEDADPERVLPLLAALVHLPERRLDEDEARLVRSGRAISGAGEGPTALWTGEGELVAVGQAAAGTIRPETVVG
jgi:tRNA pseudouridine55 synthase